MTTDRSSRHISGCLYSLSLLILLSPAFLGAAALFPSVPDWTAESDQAFALDGSSVASAGDVNGDGYGDVIVGAYSYSNGEAYEGRAYLYLGSAGGLQVSPAWTFESDQPDAWFGYAVASAGDVNGDGYDDVIAGAYQYDNVQNMEGRAYVFLGSTSGLSLTPDWTAEPDLAGVQLGRSVASAGDVNGDGYGDVVIGASNRAVVYLGSAAGLSATPDPSILGSAGFGFSAASAGDVNGDGYSDMIVGSPSYSYGETGEGRVQVYLGSASGLSTTPAWAAESDQTGANFGYSVAPAGDVDSDGYDDVIVGSVFYSNGQPQEGRVFVYMGSSSGLSALPAWTAESDQNYAYMGRSVAAIGDVNGDGYDDVIVGAYNYTNVEAYEGAAFIYLGSSTGLSATPAWMGEGEQPDALFGESVAGAGDVNGDGRLDIIIGAHGYNNGETDEGRAFAFYGSSAETPTPTDPATATPTASPSNTESPTPTATPTETMTATQTASSTRTPSETASPSPSPTRSHTSTATPSSTPTWTPSPTASWTATSSPTGTPTATATATASVVRCETLFISGNMFDVPVQKALLIRLWLCEPRKASLTVYNSAGERIRVLRPWAFSQETYLEARWDGKNDGGGFVAAGIYLIRFEGSRGADTRKLVVLR